MADWFYLHDGEQQGPVDDEALLAAVSDGSIALTDVVWTEGMADWLPVQEVMEFDEDEPAAEAAEAAEATEAAEAAEATEAAAPVSEAWHYLVDGEQAGPVSLEELGALFKGRTISGDDLVWTESLGEWQAAGTIEALAEYKPVGLAKPASRAPAKKKTTSASGKKRVITKSRGGGKKTIVRKTGGATRTKVAVAAGAGTVAAAAAAGAAASVAAGSATGASPDNRDGHWVYPGFKWLVTSFKGRIPRKKFWVGNILLMFPMMVLVGAMVGAAGYFAATSEGMVLPAIFGLLAVLFMGFMIFCSLAIAIKRWHDRGKSGVWVLIGFVPVIGIWALIETGFLEGSVGPTEYGPDPLGRK